MDWNKNGIGFNKIDRIEFLIEYNGASFNGLE